MPSTTDFASMFEGGDEGPDTEEFEAPDMTVEADDDDDDDDLERAMRSLFPVLEQTAGGDKQKSPSEQQKTSSQQSAQPDPEPADPVDAEADDGPVTALDTEVASAPRPSESQFEAIKRDVQKREAKQQSSKKKKKKSRRTEDEDEASTEEIEKIWSILEDMD